MALRSIDVGEVSMQVKNADINPFQITGASEIGATHSDARNNRGVFPFAIVIMGYVGTVLSGALFGLIAGPVGFVVGGILAGLFGIVPHVLAALCAYIWRNPSIICLVASGAGSVTGGISMFWFGGIQVSVMVIVTAVIGAIGGFLGALLGAFFSGEPARWNQLKMELESGGATGFRPEEASAVGTRSDFQR